MRSSIRRLEEQHKQIELWLADLAQNPPETPEARSRLGQEVVERLCRQVEAEEETVYTKIARHMSGDEDTERTLAIHMAQHSFILDRARRLLTAPDAKTFGERLAEVRDAVGYHHDEEGSCVFDLLHAVAGESRSFDPSEHPGTDRIDRADP